MMLAQFLKSKLDTSKVKQNPLFFRVNHKNMEKPLQLLGSYHYAPLEKLPKNIQKALTKAQVLIVEKKAEGKEFIDIFLDILKKFNGVNIEKNDPFHQLDKSLQDNIIKKLNTCFAGQLVVRNGLNNYKLWVIYCVLQLAIETEKYATAKGGIDLQLQDDFNSKKKVVVGLETFSDMIGAYDIPNFSKEKCIGLIKDLLANDTKQTQEEVQSYLEGDLTKLLKISLNDKIDPSMVGTNKRNENWMKELAEHIKTQGKKPILATVGYEHLLGEKGLLNLLKQAGFTIERADEAGNFSPFVVDEHFKDLKTDLKNKSLS